MNRKVCYCPSYAWPHRRGGGSCIWSPHRHEPTCEACGLTCVEEWRELEPEDGAGKGLYCVSKCCEAAVLQSGDYIQAPTT